MEFDDRNGERAFLPDERITFPVKLGGAAFISQAHDFPHQVIASAAESSLEHHLGMTCDPVAGFVQVRGLAVSVTLCRG